MKTLSPLSINKTFYFIALISGLAYNTGFSQKGNIFGRAFDLETSENVELVRQKIINNEIGEKFDTIIKLNDEYVFRFQKTGNYFLYYTTERGYLKLLCEKKDNIVRYLYGGTLEIIFELDKNNIIKWIQFNSLNLNNLESPRLTLNWYDNSYKIRKCSRCPSVSGFEKDISGWLDTFKRNIVFIGLESD